MLNVIFNETPYLQVFVIWNSGLSSCSWVMDLSQMLENHKQPTSQSSTRFILAYTSASDLKMMKSEAGY